MKEDKPKLIKFDKTNPEHVENIKSGDFKIHSGGYFSANKNRNGVEPRAIAKKLTTPRKLKPAPQPKEDKPAAKPAAKKAVKKAPSKKK